MPSLTAITASARPRSQRAAPSWTARRWCTVRTRRTAVPVRARAASQWSWLWWAWTMSMERSRSTRRSAPIWARSRQGRAVRSSDRDSTSSTPASRTCVSRTSPRTQANHTAWPRSFCVRARSSAGSALPVHQRFADDVQDPERSHRASRERGHHRGLDLVDFDRAEASMVDGAFPEEAGTADGLTPDRALLGAERRGQAGVRRAEQGHRRHPDRRRDVRRPAVGGDEGVELRHQRGQEGRAVAADEAPERHPGRRSHRLLELLRLGARAAPCRPRAPRAAPPADRSGPAARASTARRPRRAGGRRAGWPGVSPASAMRRRASDATRGVDRQARSSRCLVDTERPQQAEVRRHLVGRARDPAGARG